MTDDNTNATLEYLEGELKNRDNKITELSGLASSNTIFNQFQDQNLIVWQLELDNILERIEHLLRGDVVQDDGTGNIVYVEPKDKSLKILNEYGVQLIMKTISFYLNRNTILSHYDETRIFEILYDLGNELADLIYINYEKMGMDSVEKRSRYPLLVLSILHTVESAYNRALFGGERDSLRSARVVTQSLNPSGHAGLNPARRKFNPFSPKTWRL